MTREEAFTQPMSMEEVINTLKGLVFGSFGRTTPKEREALNKAIEALEADVPTPHGRLIDADKLKHKKYHNYVTRENVVAVAHIDWLPTVIEAEE